MTRNEQKAMEWLNSHDTGISSESMVYAALGLTPSRDWDAPYDPSDLGRCLRMLEKLPWVREKAFSGSALTGHRRWKIAIAHWDEMARMMADEVGISWEKGQSAPKTYEFMKKVGL